MMNDKPKPVESGFRSKLGPIPPDAFANDFPSPPEPGADPVFDKAFDQLSAELDKKLSPEK